MKLPLRVVLPLFLLCLSQLVMAQPQNDIVSHIRRQAVVSSNVASVGYSRKLHALEIEFTRGVIYRYLDVPRSIYLELMEAGSKGHFIAAEIRGKYRYLHVREPREPGWQERQLTAKQSAR
jgi:KTSC domain